MTTQALLIKRAAVAAAVFTTIAMTGCAGSGSVGLASGSPGGGSSAAGSDGGGGFGISSIESGAASRSGALRTTGEIASGGGDVLSATGNIVSAAGTALAGVNVPGANGVTAGLGAILQNTGSGVAALGQSTSAGLGQIGNIDDPLGTTARGASPLIERVGNAVSSTGQTVQAIDDGGLRVLRPVTDPAGALVDRSGRLVSSLGVKAGDGLDSGVVRKVTRTGSRVITPIADKVVGTTQAIGDRTRLGAPVDGLVTRVGHGVQGVGGAIVQKAPDSPPLTETGQLVGAVGGTVAAIGSGVLHTPDSGTGSAGLLQPLGSAVGRVLGATGANSGGSTGGGLGLGLGLGAVLATPAAR